MNLRVIGNEGLLIMPEISEIDDLDVLKAIQSGIKTAKTLDEFAQNL